MGNKKCLKAGMYHPSGNLNDSLVDIIGHYKRFREVYLKNFLDIDSPRNRILVRETIQCFNLLIPQVEVAVSGRNNGDLGPLIASLYSINELLIVWDIDQLDVINSWNQECHDVCKHAIASIFNVLNDHLRLVKDYPYKNYLD